MLISIRAGKEIIESDSHSSSEAHFSHHSNGHALVYLGYNVAQTIRLKLSTA